MKNFETVVSVVLLLGLGYVTGMPTQTAIKEQYTPVESVAAMGDSITQAANACNPWEECPKVSWATGTRPITNTQQVLLGYENPNGIDSIAGKLSSLPDGAGNEIVTFNNARSFTTTADLPNQAHITVSQNPEFVTIMSGANDICVPTENEIISDEQFRQNIHETLTILTTGLPKTKILISSIPNIYNLWEVGHTNPVAVKKWNSAELCQSMLANPTSYAEGDIERRERVTARIEGFNSLLQEECSKVSTCLFDESRVFNTVFTENELSPVDYFHPSLAGQQKIVDAVWNPTVSLHGKVSRGSIKRSSSEAPFVEIVSPQDNEVVSGSTYKAKVVVKSRAPLDKVYADTQIGGVDLNYSVEGDYWFLILDTTVVPDNFNTFFSVVAVDENGEMTVTDKVNVKVSNIAKPTPLVESEMGSTPQ